MTDINSGVNVCLVRIGRPAPDAVWTVSEMDGIGGEGIQSELASADPADINASSMLALLEKGVPDNGPNFSNITRCRPLEDGIFEFKDGSVRVLWFYDEGDPKIRRHIICTHLFRKQGRKTPRREIKKAKKRRSLYLKAKAERRLRLPQSGVLQFRREKK
ncbi:MAG: type II toxin-antitoxin system RelE/ParE family toxin [Acidobacteriota bacterium]